MRGCVKFLLTVHILSNVVLTNTEFHPSLFLLSSPSSSFGIPVILRIRGGRKGVQAKHTSADLAKKTAEALTNKGGGKAGMVDRLGGAAGHAKFVCPLCKMQTPSLKNMEEHHESKHDGIPFDPNACQNTHEIFGGTTKGVAVHGTLKKAKVKAKEKKSKGDDE